MPYPVLVMSLSSCIGLERGVLERYGLKHCLVHLGPSIRGRRHNICLNVKLDQFIIHNSPPRKLMLGFRLGSTSEKELKRNGLAEVVSHLPSGILLEHKPPRLSLRPSIDIYDTPTSFIDNQSRFKRWKWKWTAVPVRTLLCIVQGTSSNHSIGKDIVLRKY
ncbi:hypothetical protein FA15DRAFT_670176 [Coprinopsis marcescibilis]|uniref:Uncharacterized protein n=1 Tax=Coprinopsis marcescibilis TaxID=230819 RepID=A0A5C3L678_COPMA|nr:hypothetical protein FA15DRAFT_670176 [Coprinopsis marcescibilis]